MNTLFDLDAYRDGRPAPDPTPAPPPGPRDPGVTPTECIDALRRRPDASPFCGGRGVCIQLEPDLVLRWGATVRVTAENARAVCAQVTVRSHTGEIRRTQRVMRATHDLLSWLVRFVAVPFSEELEAQLVDDWDQAELL